MTYWKNSYEYQKWKVKSTDRFPIGSIKQFYYQTDILRKMPSWIIGFQSSDVDDIAYMHGSLLSYYLGVGVSYGQHNTLTLTQYFKDLEQ
jgi:hypothetical protein